MSYLATPSSQTLSLYIYNIYIYTLYLDNVRHHLLAVGELPLHFLVDALEHYALFPEVVDLKATSTTRMYTVGHGLNRDTSKV